MKFLGEKTSPERQAQALRAVEKMLETWKKGRAQKMLRIAQKSWRIKHDVNHIWMPEIAATELQSINFISDMIIDAHVLLKQKLETKQYIVSDLFRQNREMDILLGNPMANFYIILTVLRQLQ